MIDRDTATIPVETADPVNAAILAVSEDRLQGFQEEPFHEIARLSGVELGTVLERIRAMLAAGTIRRVRQTLMATNLARGRAGRLGGAGGQPRRGVRLHVPAKTPSSGHVVIRSTDRETTGSKYRLWTTLKVPQGFSMQKHAEFLAARTGALSFKLMPAKALFALGVGHVRRRGMEPGARSDEPGAVLDTHIVELSELEWRVLMALKRELEVGEVREHLWTARAEEAGVPLATFWRWRAG